MFRIRKTDVLVAGAGPVGMFTAMALAERGIDVELFDSEWRTTGRSYALGLHPSSLELFDQLGLADDLISHGFRVDTVAFYRGSDRLGEMRLGELDRKYPFVLVLPQNRLEQTLEKGLKKRRIKVHWNHRLARLVEEQQMVAADIDHLSRDSSGYALAWTGTVIDKTFTTRAHLALGADGHSSAMRHLLDINFAHLGEPLLFAVFEFTIAGEPRHEMRIVLDDDTVSVLWPLRDGRCRWSFQIPGTVTEEIPRIKSRFSIQIGEQAFPFVREENLEKLIAERAPWFTEQVDKIRWSLAVQFENRLADSFGRDRTWLVGDSTHVTGPAGIQSMNLGLSEAWELAELAAGVVRGQKSTDALAGYGTKHRESWLDLLSGRVPEAGETAPEWARQAAGRLVPLLPAAGDDLATLLAQVGLK